MQRIAVLIYFKVGFLPMAGVQRYDNGEVVYILALGQFSWIPIVFGTFKSCRILFFFRTVGLSLSLYYYSALSCLVLKPFVCSKNVIHFGIRPFPCLPNV